MANDICSKAQRGGFGVSVNEAAFDGAFALPYEIGIIIITIVIITTIKIIIMVLSYEGLYKQFELSPVNYRPIGCPGLFRE